MYERASVRVMAWASNMRSLFREWFTPDAAPRRRTGRRGVRGLGRSAWGPGVVGRAGRSGGGPPPIRDATTGGDVRQDGRDEVGVAVLDGYVRGRHSRRVPGPGRD